MNNELIFYTRVRLNLNPPMDGDDDDDDRDRSILCILTFLTIVYI